MNFTFIDITEIFRRQNKVLKSETSNWLVFYLIPLALGFSFALLFYADSKEIMNTLTLFLSIFIPIFINLLATLISFVMNKGEFYQFNLSSCIRQQNSLTAQFVSFSLANLANIFYPPPIFTIINLCLL